MRDLFCFINFQLHNVFSGLFAVAHDTYHPVKAKNLDLERTDCLKQTIRSYFQTESFDSDEYEKIVEADNPRNNPGLVDEISNDIYTLISRWVDGSPYLIAYSYISLSAGTPRTTSLDEPSPGYFTESPVRIIRL